MKNIIDKFITAISTVLLIWFAVSFVQINTHNRLGDEPLSEEQANTNLICIMYSVMFDN